MLKPHLAALLAVVLTSTAATATERTVTLAVENMTCALCPITVSRAIEAVPGVTSVEVDMDTSTALVTFDDAVASPQHVADASTNAGYPATLVKP
ncbi:MAG: heavy-metal-associated domain-containing protein [Geminicoccaceae bacterium]